jgi:Icc protein
LSTTPLVPADRPVLLVQLTDSHLYAEADGKLLGLVTRDTLQRVIEQVLVEQPAIDLVLATGDLSQDGTRESYQAFDEMTACLGAPIRWFAGNHDETLGMQAYAGERDLMQPVVDIGNWRITLLDSSVSGSVPGFLAQDQLQLLARSLEEAPERHHLVCLHHHPVSIDCRWMAPIGLRNAEALFEVLDRFSHVRALLWGHIHQDFDRQREGVRLLATPSTCIQFKPLSDEFQLDTLAPGYRWLKLLPDGQLETGVSRLADFQFTPDFSAEGY